MSHNATHSVRLLAVVSAIGVLSSCSSTRMNLQKGTPAFYWQAAKETFAAGDYNKTLDHLDRVLATENEYTARALPFSLVLSSGMAAGYMEVADNAALGARVNRAQPAVFHRLASENRALANRLVLHAAELVGKLPALNGHMVRLAFGYPKGSASPVQLFTPLANGIALSPAEVEMAQSRAVERGVLMAACRAAGAPSDTAKAEQILNNGDALVPHATFMNALAGMLYVEAQLYSRDRLDEPDKTAILCHRAQEALSSVPESRDTRELSAKIQKLLQKGS